MGSLKENWPGLLVALLSLGLGVYLLPALPARCAIHFDASGQPNGYAGPLAVVLLLPLFTIAMVLLVPALLSHSPKGIRSENNRRAVSGVMLALALLFAVLQTGILLFNLDPRRHSMSRFITLGLALFLLSLGWVLGKTERNAFVGIRTPWSIASDRNWRATHLWAARLMIFGGAFLVPMGIARMTPMWAIAVACLTVLVPAIYSYGFYRRYERSSE